MSINNQYLIKSLFCLSISVFVFWSCTSDERTNIYDPLSPVFLGSDSVELIREYAYDCTAGVLCYDQAKNDSALTNVPTTRNGLCTLSIESPLRIDAVGSRYVTLKGKVKNLSALDFLKVEDELIQVNTLDSTWEKAVVLKPEPFLTQILLLTRDTLGNYFSDTLELYYLSNHSDTEPPLVSVKGIQTGDSVFFQKIQLSGTILDESDFNLTVNGLPAEITDNYWFIDIVLTPGINNISIFAEDSSVNNNIKQINLVLVFISADSVPADTDRTKPELTLISHVSGSTVGDSMAVIQVMAKDQTGINWVKINDEIMTAYSGDTLYTKTIKLKNGANLIKITTQDKSLNSNQSSLIFSLLYNKPDVTPPAIQLISPVNGDTILTEQVTITVSATDDESGIANGIIYLNSSPMAYNSASSLYQLTVALVSGYNAFQISANDGATPPNGTQLDFTLFH
ncbi:MAG: hypothetical protein HQK83_03910 [Fibrobacteria bacterium]|nr:hypothetical protein [Fibrobacteria bacterium]